jgi:chorismate-pyruvate lyase
MALPSLPLRMLLHTDGSVTTLLEGTFGAPIAVETRSSSVERGALRRTAILRLAPDGRPLLRARSELALAEHERFAVAWAACAVCALLAAVTVSITGRVGRTSTAH